MAQQGEGLVHAAGGFPKAALTSPAASVRPEVFWRLLGDSWSVIRTARPRYLERPSAKRYMSVLVLQASEQGFKGVGGEGPSALQRLPCERRLLPDANFRLTFRT